MVIEIQRSVAPFMGGGGRGGGFGGGFFGAGSALAEPGTYSVKLPVNGKTSVGTVTVRLDPIQSDLLIQRTSHC